MTATLEIPDELYRKAARSGARLGEVAVHLIEGWVMGEAPPQPQPSATQWLEQWVKLGAQTCAGLPSSPTTRDLLDEGRNRNL